MDPTGAVVLVTGASRGIGREVARMLAEAGAHVAVSGRDRTALGEVAAASGATAVVADLRGPEAPARLVEEVVARLGRLDAVVSSAGIGHVGPLSAMTDRELADLVDVNLRAPLLLGRAAVDQFHRQGEPAAGSLCFVTSIAGAVGVPEEAVYSATKSAVDQFAVLLREQVRGSRIRVATVVPGVVDTEFLAARQVPYDRRFPRPLPPERVGRVVVAALGTDARRFVPGWLAVPAWLARTAPGGYRALARRFG